MYHGMATPASTDTRALTADGSTASLYSASCSSNHSTHGTDTTRALMPSPARVLAAATAHWTSEPVAMMMTSGVPSVSTSTYAPFFTPSLAFSAVSASTGTP